MPTGVYERKNNYKEKSCPTCAKKFISYNNNKTHCSKECRINHGERECIKCKVTQPIAHFTVLNKNSKNKTGRRKTCRKCLGQVKWDGEGRNPSKYLGKNGKSTCCHCGKTKPITDFVYDLKKQQGIKYYRKCKDCHNAYARERRKDPKRKKRESKQAKRRLEINKRNPEYYDKKRKLKNEWREKNREQSREYEKKYYSLNKEKINKRRKEQRNNMCKDPEKLEKLRELKRNWSRSEKGKESIKKSRSKNYNKTKKYLYNKYHTNPQYKLSCLLRSRLSHAVRGRVKHSSTIDLLGMTIDDFKCYFKSKFKRGMSWKKFLAGDIHIDHIKPCASFDLTKESEQKKCFHYTNLQPLWAMDNFKKGAKIAA
tara:strand:- start:948 stop:2054 length:1107 start_codon:yes stop_codon:yes gene_type:complete